MNHFKVIILLIVFMSSGNAQGKFGIECKIGQNTTFNSSKIEGGGNGYLIYEVTNENNPSTRSYSFGLMYALNPKFFFKLHVGRHQNGRILSLIQSDDAGGYWEYENADLPYKYLQFTPSMSYRFLDGPLKLPIEIGVSVNKLVNDDDIFFVEIKEYNVDVRMSGGLQYELNNFLFGANLTYSHALSNYLQKDVRGGYLPYQFGIEFSVGYMFK
ncbi:MAG: outer membrane beta-barrel protein [Lewinellaceae bacterium]|nr:outer membrane beta-barrel protein [Lewinellaceae bacterium]